MADYDHYLPGQQAFNVVRSRITNHPLKHFPLSSVLAASQVVPFINSRQGITVAAETDSAIGLSRVKRASEMAYSASFSSGMKKAIAKGVERWVRLQPPAIPQFDITT